MNNEKFKKLTPKEIMQPAKLTDLTGKELTPEEVQELARIHEEQVRKNNQFFEENKDEDLIQNLFPRR